MRKGTFSARTAICLDSDRSGYLVKQGKLCKNWKKRWFVLKGCNVYYFRNSAATYPLKIIQLDEESSVFTTQADKRTAMQPYFTFQIHTKHRTWYLRAPTLECSRFWVESVTNNLVNMKETKRTKARLLILSSFYATHIGNTHLLCSLINEGYDPEFQLSAQDLFTIQIYECDLEGQRKQGGDCYNFEGSDQEEEEEERAMVYSGAYFCYPACGVVCPFPVRVVEKRQDPAWKGADVTFPVAGDSIFHHAARMAQRDILFFLTYFNFDYMAKVQNSQHKSPRDLAKDSSTQKIFETAEKKQKKKRHQQPRSSPVKSSTD
eukprot:TRINITY_DN8126_c0_g1_i2.p1 TRINITY_DN8126_c0_g1~~TRINITY_DN8126_c0_g1_i2.p1  ORF type:complete len:319 (-),score=38.30 TRINITY_DN8126_c0_g1_i2:35-991(-)